jgi:hypothetical protein
LALLEKLEQWDLLVRQEKQVLKDLLEKQEQQDQSAQQEKLDQWDQPVRQEQLVLLEQQVQHYRFMPHAVQPQQLQIKKLCLQEHGIQQSDQLSMLNSLQPILLRILHLPLNTAQLHT